MRCDRIENNRFHRLFTWSFSLSRCLSYPFWPYLRALRSLHALSKKEGCASLCFLRSRILSVPCVALLLHVFINNNRARPCLPDRPFSCCCVVLCELEADEQETLAQLRSLHPEVEQAYALVQQFAHILRTHTGQQLDAWLEKARASKIRELQGFLAGLIRDKAAVTAGLTLSQNNGVVEGKVNKLKLIKRMGYGRADFPLLRQRVLHAL